MSVAAVSFTLSTIFSRIFCMELGNKHNKAYYSAIFPRRIASFPIKTFLRFLYCTVSHSLWLRALSSFALLMNSAHCNCFAQSLLHSNFPEISKLSDSVGYAHRLRRAHRHDHGLPRRGRPGRLKGRAAVETSMLARSMLPACYTPCCGQSPQGVTTIATACLELASSLVPAPSAPSSGTYLRGRRRRLERAKSRHSVERPTTQRVSSR